MMINSVENTKDQEDLYIRKGQLKVLAYLLNFESNMETSFEELEKKMKIFDFRCENGHVFEEFVDGTTTASRCGCGAAWLQKSFQLLISCWMGQLVIFQAGT